MEEIDFSSWWADFNSQFKNLKDADYFVLNRLQQYFNALLDDKKLAFLEELLNVSISQGDNWTLATEFLEREATLKERRVIFKYLSESLLINEDFEETHTVLRSVKDENRFKWNLCLYFRVLAAEQSNEFINFIERNVSYKTVSSYCVGVFWLLWPNHKDNFVKLFSDFFMGVDSKVWSGNGLIQTFQTRTEPLVYLRDYLMIKSENTWKIFQNSIVADEVTKWLSKEQVRELERIVNV